jgi:hypothetical protein
MPARDPAVVTLSGPQQAFNLLVPGDLKFSINLAGFAAGTHRIALDATRIRGNNGLEIEHVEPGVITVMLTPAEQPGAG